MSEHISKFEILKQFTIKNPDEVEKYLSQHPSLESVLQEAYERIQHHFPDHEIELKVVIDYEIPDWITLFAYVWTNMEVETSLARLHELDDTWYLDLPFAIREKFSINVKYK